MKRLLMISVGVLLLGNVVYSAESYRLQAGHFDMDGGSLTINARSEIPLPDGCHGEIIMVAGSACREQLAAQRRSLEISREPGDLLPRSLLGVFQLNGGELFGVEGWFLTNVLLTGTAIPDQPIALRIWNAPAPNQATGYWESPPYRILPGLQQVSFRRDEWTFHAVDRGREGICDDDPTAVEGEAGLAQSHELLETWPNPFNAAARIRIYLDRTESVQLRAYDVNGRLVRELINGALAAGYHDLTFEAGALPAGLYFLSLQKGHESPVVRRLLLIR